MKKWNPSLNKLGSTKNVFCIQLNIPNAKLIAVSCSMEITKPNWIGQLPIFGYSEKIFTIQPCMYLSSVADICAKRTKRSQVLYA